MLTGAAEAAAACAVRLPRARPEPRVEPNVPVGAEVSADPGVADETGAEWGSLGAAAGVPDVTGSDMLLCCL